MKNYSKLLMLCLILYSVKANAQTFNAAVNPHGTNVTGNAYYGVSIGLFGGKPGIVFSGESGTGPEYPKFIMSRDSTGTNWSNEYLIQTVTDVNINSVALVNVNDTPAAFYIANASTDSLIYERADNDTGSSWTATTHVLHAANLTIQVLRAAIVNGNPAVTFRANGSPDTLFYIRANDATGSSWPGSPTVISTMSSNIQDQSFSVIDGKPAVCFYESLGDSLMYIIANDSNGSTWSTPVKIADGRVSNFSYPDLAEINGRPAIAYLRNTTSDTLFYIRANDATGSSWPSSPVAIYHPGNSIGSHLSLGAMADTPVIFFEWSGNNDNYWVKAANTTGSSWNTPIAFSSVNEGDELDMIIDADNNIHLAFYEIGGDSLGYIYGLGSGPTTWNGSTWSDGTPTATDNAAIASNTTPGNFSCKNLTINSGFALTMAGGTTANINGNVTNNGNGFSGTGTFNFAASGSLYGNTISTEGTITVASGATLTTNDKLTLASNASNTGRAGNSAGSISGNVTVERYIPGKRAFRFFAHPFSSGIELSQLTDDIDISGSGGSTNGFTTTGTNNPSAFWYDVTSANGSGSNDAGWTAFTSATSSSGSNGWDQYEGIRVLVRGTKGQGLSGGAYTPGAVTMDMTGPINQGTQIVNVTKGSSSIYAMVGNPFPCQIQMNALSRGGSIASFYYLWDATAGARGAYSAKLYSSSYILPSGASFVTAIAATSTITFPESCKSTSTPASVFKPTAGQNNLVIGVYSNNDSVKWDELQLYFDNTTSSDSDWYDAGKWYNPDLAFYSYSKDNKMLAIDTRPYKDKEVIQLGVAYARQNRYTFRADEIDIDNSMKLFLHDKYLNKTEEIKPGFEYIFDVTSDSLSQGDNRFEINMKEQPAVIITQVYNAGMILSPNPAHDEVKVTFEHIDGGAELQVISIAGQVMYTQPVSAEAGSIIIPMHNIPQGIYVVKLNGENASFTRKLIRK